MLSTSYGEASGQIDGTLGVSTDFSAMLPGF